MKIYKSKIRKILFLVALLFLVGYNYLANFDYNSVSFLLEETSKETSKETSRESEDKKPPKEFGAEVIGVKDGDTVEVLYKKQPIIIRLDHIDCPEKKQDYGNAAKQFVSDRIHGKKVIVLHNGKKDRWGRFIGVIQMQNGDILNKILVQNGLAMHYKQYSKDDSYDLLEKEAKNQKRGIWSRKDVVEPWNFRKLKREEYTLEKQAE